MEGSPLDSERWRTAARARLSRPVASHNVWELRSSAKVDDARRTSKFKFSNSSVSFHSKIEEAHIAPRFLPSHLQPCGKASSVSLAMKRIEPDGTAHERDERSALRARREPAANNDDQTSNNDSTKPSSRSISDVTGILQHTIEKITTAEDVPREENTPTVVIAGSSSRAAVATDLLVCANCTFGSEKPSSSLTTLPLLFCELCDHPLQHQQRGPLPAVPMKTNHRQPAQDTMTRSGYSRSADRLDLKEELRPSPRSTPWITAADFASMDDDEMGVKCPTCTVFIPNATDKTRCSLCDTALAPSYTARFSSDVEIEIARECTTCTLLNAPGASVCSACETPLSDDGDFSAGDLVGVVVGGDTDTRGFVLGIGEQHTEHHHGACILQTVYTLRQPHHK